MKYFKNVFDEPENAFTGKELLMNFFFAFKIFLTLEHFSVRTSMLVLSFDELYNGFDELLLRFLEKVGDGAVMNFLQECF